MQSFNCCREPRSVEPSDKCRMGIDTCTNAWRIHQKYFTYSIRASRLSFRVVDDVIVILQRDLEEVRGITGNSSGVAREENFGGYHIFSRKIPAAGIFH